MAGERNTGSKRDNSGYLFTNKKTKDTQPDWRGKITISGKEWAVSGWNRDTPDGAMISVALTDPDTLPARSTGTGSTSNAGAQGSTANAPSAPASGGFSGANQSRPVAPASTPSHDPLLDELDDLFGPEKKH